MVNLSVRDLSVTAIAYFIRVQISKIDQFKEIIEKFKEIIQQFTEMIEHPTQIS